MEKLQMEEIRDTARRIATERLKPRAAETDRTRAKKEEDNYVINGTKFFITSAGEADVYLVLVRTNPEKGPQGMTTLLVEVVERLFRDARGLTLHFKTSEWLRQDVAKAALGL